MSKKDFSPIFNKFAGKEVNVIEWREPAIGGGSQKNVDWYRLDDKDPVVKAFYKAAQSEGLFARLWLPNTEGCYLIHKDKKAKGEPSYMVGYVEKHDDGKWRITDNFRIF